MNLKSIFFLSFISIFLSQTDYSYSEDFSSIDQLTYLEAKTNEVEEVYIGSYFQGASTLTPKKDFHNGIKIFPKEFQIGGGQIGGGQSCSITSFNGGDDYAWDYTDNGQIYYPPTYILTNGDCKETAGSVLDLSIFLSEEDIGISRIYNLSYYFYFWIDNINNNDDVKFSCSDNPGSEITFGQLNIGLHQLYLKYNTTEEKFSLNDGGSFECSSMKVLITNTANGGSDDLHFHKLKLSVVIDKKTISVKNCTDHSNLCPFSYYCDTNTGECKKCLGIFAECENRNTGKVCSRFTTNWKDVGNLQTSCKGDYFNLQYLDEMTYDINPPIKSNAASISFWLFTTKDIYEAELVDDINPNIYHITLEDFFVVTIIPRKEQYVIYVTGFEMYHEAYGKKIKDLKTKKDFDAIIKSFPFKYWKIHKEVEKINRWINVIVSFNKNTLKLSMQIFYKKRDVASTGSLVIDDYMVKRVLMSEFIYNKDEDNIADLRTSRLHFKKFYRNSDTTHLNIKIYNNNIGVYFRKLYVFVTELLIQTNLNPGYSKYLFGFQHIEFEKIFKLENYLMPELILAVPFENITKSTADDNKYFIEYYIYDMSKMYNNLNKKLLTINPGNIEDSLYYYSLGLYRLNLISAKNKKFKLPTLADTEDESCENYVDYCYQGGNPYSCNTGYLLEPNNRDCTQINFILNSNSETRLLVPGINAKNNQKGTLTDICYETCIRKTNSLSLYLIFN